MITNNEAQAALIAWMQANTTITALLTDTDEIREDNWQGEKFTYPNIRVMCEMAGAKKGCGPDEGLTTISCFSEQKSSKEAQNMAGVIANQLHNKTFTQDGIRFSAIRARTPRARQENGVWRSEIQLNMGVK